jgi:hypothetical protein
MVVNRGKHKLLECSKKGELISICVREDVEGMAFKQTFLLFKEKVEVILA